LLFLPPVDQREQGDAFRAAAETAYQFLHHHRGSRAKFTGDRDSSLDHQRAQDVDHLDTRLQELGVAFAWARAGQQLHRLAKGNAIDRGLDVTERVQHGRTARGASPDGGAMTPRTMPPPGRWTTWTVIVRRFASSLIASSASRSGKDWGSNRASITAP